MLFIYDLLLSVGVVQGMLSGFLLLVSKSKQPSMTILGIIMLVCSLVNLKYLAHINYYFFDDYYLFQHTNIVLLLCPLSYLYVLSIVQRDVKLKKVFMLHFIPSILYFICDIFSYTDYIEHQYFSNNVYFSLICAMLKISNIESLLTIVSCAIYVHFTYLKLKEFGLEKIVISF